MGNTHIKPHPRQRNKKQVHWKAAARPHAPGKPFLVSNGDSTPDLVTIRWIKPISDGGSPISGYLVEHRRAGSPHWVRATPLLVQLTELTISGLEPGWRYQFRVRAENAVGLSDSSELSEPITVTLQRSAVTSPRITQDLQDTVSLENEKAEFVVHFLGQPAPKICWYKDAFEIFSSRRIRILTEPDRSVLTIHQCSLSDEGEIKCTATNRAGHVSTKAKLTVNAPPSIRLPRQYADGLLFEIGELIRLKVSLAGRPTPLVFWSHNGESIRSNDRYEIESVDNTSILKINDAQREDRGEYIIKAVNKLGEDVQSFLVTVTDKPSPPGRARVLMALGRTVTLSWSTPQDDGGCKIGNYIVEYYRLGWDVWLKAATSRQLTTILGDLIEGSEYKFRIKAESPYGVSEPSEESDVIFIPDVKRGMTEPPPRSKSQPRDIIDKVVTPVARRKNKLRSLSSPRVDEEQLNISNTPPETNTLPPKRPMRTKVKSPSKTPEASPLPMRKDLENPSTKRDLETKLNKEIFERSDRSSMDRDLAYGSPDIKVKRELQPMSSLSSNVSSGSDRSRTPSPKISPKANDHQKFTVKIEPPPEQNITRKTPPASPEMRKLGLSRENSENLTGSSEFMLVLYHDEDQKGQSEFDFGDNSIPPPMSLSAPELGVGSPIFNVLKTSASSTELLHERAMNRLYEAAEAEEKELERRRKSIESRGLNSEIPKIQINSKDQQEKLDLERIHSLKRRISGGTTKQLRLRRHSYKDPDDFKDADFKALLKKSNLSQDEKKLLMMNRQRSESEEKEEKVFQEVRSKKAPSSEKRKINVADIENWGDDYVSSTEESSFEEEDDEHHERNHRKLSFFNSEDEEEQTYNPRGRKMLAYSDKEPFEILTKRKEPPSPDFIPKPILKKTEHDEISSFSSPPTSPKLKRALSPIPPNIFRREISLAEASVNLPLLQRTIPEGEEISINSRPRSSSLTYEDTTFAKTFDEHKPKNPRKRAFSLLPQAELFQKSIAEEKPISGRQRSFSLIPPADDPKTEVTPESIYNFEQPQMSFIMRTISAAATVSGITAASIVIPDRLVEKQKDAEEAKVVVDHYGDIVKNYGSKQKNIHIHQSRESLHRQSRESLPRVDESKEELSLLDHPEPKKASNFAKNNIQNIQSNNYQDPYSQIKPSENKQNLKSDNISNYRDPYSSHTAYQKEMDNETQSMKKVGPSPPQSSQSQLHEMQRGSPSHSPEERQRKSSPPYSRGSASPSSTSARSRTVSETSDTGKRTTSNTTKARSPQSDRSNKTRAFSPQSDKESDKITTRRPRTFSPPADSYERGKTPPGRKVNPSPLRKFEKRKSSSPYPTNRTPVSQIEDLYQNKIPSKRKTSPSPMRSKRTEPSPMRLRPPKLKEIMTQTSESLGSFEDNYPAQSLRNSKQEELIAKAEVKVHRFVDYLTDLVMFMVACWLYLFKNELFAIPVLLVMVYRQLQAEISKRIPNWLVRLVRRLRRSKQGNTDNLRVRSRKS